MEALGPRIRRQRRRQGFTLDELAVKTRISKPYLSLIETGRVANPPSDDKLRRLEQVLGFEPSALVTQAHLIRTPRDVRLMLTNLLRREGTLGRDTTEDVLATMNASALSISAAVSPTSVSPAASGGLPIAGDGANRATRAVSANRGKTARSSQLGIDLDSAFMDGALQRLVDQSAPNVESVKLNAIPIINRVSAGYPKDFTDLNYPRGVADEWIGCPHLFDPDAFACRVHGDSMTPKYQQDDIVVFSPASDPRNGDDCFVRFDDGLTTFKRVFFEVSEGKEVIRLQPRNEKYRPQTVPAESITGVYKAKFRYQSVEGN